MPVTRRVIGELAGRGYPPYRHAHWGYVTANSVPMFEWLAATGADFGLGTCDPNTVEPGVVDHLERQGLAFFGRDRDAIAWRPQLVMDTGGDLLVALAEAGTPPSVAVESTATGLIRLQGLSDLSVPVLQWADIPLKHDIEQRCHVVDGVFGAITWLTGLSQEGRSLMVVGHGS